MTIKPKSSNRNEYTKAAAYQLKPKYSFEISIHTNSKSTDKRNEITRTTKQNCSLWKEKELNVSSTVVHWGSTELNVTPVMSAFLSKLRTHELPNITICRLEGPLLPLHPNWILHAHLLNHIEPWLCTYVLMSDVMAFLPWGRETCITSPYT